MDYRKAVDVDYSHYLMHEAHINSMRKAARYNEPARGAKK
jgi:hypothetical protein